MNFIQQLCSTSSAMMPHGHCYLWHPPLVWLHVISDGLITLSYFTIPITLIYIARKRKDLPFDWIFACFGLFILACGVTHALQIWTLWVPAYWISGIAKGVTAIVSVATAILLVKLIPKLLAIPSPTELREANAALIEEAKERKLAEIKLQESHDELENRVVERTQALETANKALDRASQLKDEFLANMSHELRTPLNAILGLSEALLEQHGGTLTPRQSRSITTISTSGEHLLELINDILDLSKIEAGKLDLNAETLNLKHFCDSCLVFVKTQAAQKRLQIDFDFDNDDATFEADSRRFKQVLVNLLTNAVKFTPEGGRVGLAVSQNEQENTITFTVSDTGIGISEADQSKLFQAFSQIDSGLARGQEGSGLGLALVARLTELHGGNVILKSKPGEGSQFIITLPQGDHTSSLPPPSPPKDKTDHRGYHHALIIEDDPEASDQIQRYLAELEIECSVHPRGEEVVEVALNKRPDVILLDIMLPNESGWVALTRLKEHPGTKDIPIIMVSVMDEPKKSRDLGAMAHFTKPVTREQLADFFQRQPSKESHSSAPFESTASRNAPVVLLAEDNAANRETFGGYLEDKGYTLHYAINGTEAFELAEKLRPDIILMDIQMPLVDGLTAIKTIRQQSEMQGIPIIALTALTMPGDRQRCLEAGATDYMSKPVKLKTLHALIKKLTKTAPPPGDT